MITAIWLRIFLSCKKVFGIEFYIYIRCRRGKWERVEGERGRGESEMGEGREREKTLTFATLPEASPAKGAGSQ